MHAFILCRVFSSGSCYCGCQGCSARASLVVTVCSVRVSVLVVTVCSIRLPVLVLTVVFSSPVFRVVTMCSVRASVLVVTVGSVRLSVPVLTVCSVRLS